MILKEIQPCTIDPVFEIKEYKCSFGWQVMIIGLSGVQLSLLLLLIPKFPHVRQSQLQFLSFFLETQKEVVQDFVIQEQILRVS